MNCCFSKNCAPESHPIANSELLQDALSCIVQSADTTWAADSASLKYHLLCKKTYLLYRKLQVFENVLSVEDVASKTISSKAANLSVQDIIPGSRLASYGNFTYSSEDTLFKKINQTENGNIADESELSIPSETPLILEPWQEGIVSQVFRHTGKLFGTRDPENIGKNKWTNLEEKSFCSSVLDFILGLNRHVRGVAGVAIEPMCPLSSKTETKPGKKQGGRWPTSDQDNCALCKNSLGYLTEYSEWLKAEDRPYISEEEVLLARNPTVDIDHDRDKLTKRTWMQRLTSTSVRNLWSASENNVIASATTWTASQTKTNATKMQRSFVPFTLRLSADVKDSEDDHSTAAYSGLSKPCLERVILEKNKELLQLVDEEAGISTATTQQPHSYTSRYEHSYWEFVSPERICNKQDFSPRMQTYAEVCQAKAARTFNQRANSVCKKSKSQSSLSARSGIRQIKSTYSHDNLTPIKLSPAQSIDQWPALTASTPIQSRNSELPELRNSNSMQFSSPPFKNKKKTGTKHQSNYNLPLSQLFSVSPIENQHTASTVKSSNLVRPRAITGCRFRACGVVGEKSQASKRRRCRASEATGQHSETSGIEADSCNYGTTEQVHVQHPKWGLDETPKAYRKYHWNSAAVSNKHSVACSTDGTSFDFRVTQHTSENEGNSFQYGATKEDNYKTQRDTYCWTAASQGNVSSERNALQIERGFSQSMRPLDKNCAMEKSQNPPAAVSQSSMEDSKSTQQENFLANRKQYQLEGNYPYPNLWISGQFFDTWNFQHFVAPIQYQTDSCLTSAQLVRFFEMQPFYTEKAIQNVMANSIPFAFPPLTSTSTTASCRRIKYNTAWPLEVPIWTSKSSSDNSGMYNKPNAGSACTNQVKNALCLSSAPRSATKFMHQSHQCKSRNLQNVIRVIGVKLQESIVELQENTTKESHKKSSKGAIDNGNVVDVPSDSCQATVANPDQTASCSLSEETVTDDNSKKLMRGLGILMDEACPSNSKSDPK